MTSKLIQVNDERFGLVFVLNIRQEHKDFAIRFSALLCRNNFSDLSKR